MANEDTSSVVRTVKLTKIFRDFWLREKVTAVCDLDLDIGRHEVFGLLGPNGSGKSTTLKMILGLMFPTRGQIAVFGRRPTDVRTKARIGFLPEESHLYPFLSAFETLDFYGQLFRQPRRQRHHRIEMLLDMVGLSAVAYRRVGEYSKGMQRRIGLAQALINDPDLLILDEPTSGLDPIGTRQFKDLIRTLAMRGKTVLLSSHLLGDVEDVCDRICVLYGGRRRREGSVSELLACQDRTQITTDKLDDDTIEQVRELVETGGREVLDVTSPRDKLESLFLDIVSEAQAQQLDTGGAIAGGQVAQFLKSSPETEPQGREVIEQLVTGAAVDEEQLELREAPGAGDVERVDEAPVRETVVDELLAAAQHDDTGEKPDKNGDDTPQPPPAAPQPPPPQADRGVIDDLIAPSPDDDEEAR
ncbi:MAG: ABC transporter ATP-binding protein [Phycisphaerae bacterium]|nr:ABC transporter ATP-binding protein [Phycisphaerae bacterium]